MQKGTVLYVKDLDRMTAFYASFAGEISENVVGEYAIVSDHDSQFILLSAPKEIADQIEISSPPRIRAETPIKPILKVTNLTECLEVAKSLGGTTPPNSATWNFQGHSVQDIVDPEGNVIQLWQQM